MSLSSASSPCARCCLVSSFCALYGLSHDTTLVMSPLISSALAFTVKLRSSMMVSVCASSHKGVRSTATISRVASNAGIAVLVQKSRTALTPSLVAPDEARVSGSLKENSSGYSTKPICRMGSLRAASVNLSIISMTLATRSFRRPISPSADCASFSSAESFASSAPATPILPFRLFSCPAAPSRPAFASAAPRSAAVKSLLASSSACSVLDTDACSSSKASKASPRAVSALRRVLERSP
mmetsp:Transcript_6398/g.20583  ORF Transcript_6398/g.20583 Transcript_6398/m.20583 type:complete len:240 (-) Transcript_6398:625-1344(-)